MPSPFPGMDPYIEHSKIWPDFHNRLADEISSKLNGTIRPAYFARLVPHTTYEIIEVATSRFQTIRPDVGVLKTDTKPKRKSANSGGLLVLDKITPAPVESVALHEVPLELVRIEIRRSDNEVLVTAIEILSPVNKQPSHAAYSDYMRKRRDLMPRGLAILVLDVVYGVKAKAAEYFAFRYPPPLTCAGLH